MMKNGLSVSGLQALWLGGTELLLLTARRPGRLLKFYGSSSSLLLTPGHDEHRKCLIVCLLCGRAAAEVPGCPGSPHGAGWA